MNLILLQPADYIAPDCARLLFNHATTIDKRAQHIRDILGAAHGATIKIGDLNGLLGNGKIIEFDEHGITLQVTRTQPPPPKLPLTIILALPRPKVLRRIVRTVAELGVQKLILLNTYKVEKSYWQSPALAPAMLRDYLCEGLQQARDTVLPDIQLERLFKPFVEDRLPTILGDTMGLIAHPGTHATCPLAIDRACTLAIGPEGGFTDYEVTKLQQAGCNPIQLGARILRVETALTALVSRLYP